MNIFISANDNYIYAAKVMLTSFFKNNPGEHAIYFMYSTVARENLQALGKLAHDFGAAFIPTEIDVTRFERFVSTERFPAEVYFRLLIAEIAPNTETRALWLDVDLVVHSSLEEFYGQDLTDCTFAACRDIGDHTDRLLALSCPEGTVYINSGVILFNLERMRGYCLHDYYTYYLAHKDSIGWPDQDILNGMFCGQIKIWDCDRYNVQVSNWRFHNEYALDDAAIIHYIGNGKPWFSMYTNSAARIWDDYHRIAFDEGAAYLLRRRMHRFLEKYIFAHVRSACVMLSRRCPWIKKVRALCRR